MRRSVTAALIGALIGGSVFVLTAGAVRNEQVPPTVIAVVGDSYTAGVDNEAVWPTLLGQRTGWRVANFALPGAGFSADGTGGYAFARQVERAAALHPTVILVVGGLADERFAWSGRISVSAVETLNKIKLAGPEALVVGPTYYETPVPPSVLAVSQEISKVSALAGVPFLDALDPPWLTPDLMQPDLSGPSDSGQSLIADKVAAWLRTEVPA